MTRFSLILVAAALTAFAQQVPKTVQVFNPSAPAGVTVDRDVAGTTVRIQDLTVRYYPGMFGNVTVQQGNQPAVPVSAIPPRPSMFPIQPPQYIPPTLNSPPAYGWPSWGSWPSWGTADKK